MRQTNTLNGENLLELERLSAKVDSLQRQVDSLSIDLLLPFAQTTLQYGNNILVFAGVFVALVGIGVPVVYSTFKRIYSKSLKEAISETTKTVEESIAKGVLPENSEVRTKLINAVLKSGEFKEILERVRTFRAKSERAEREAYSRIKDSEVQTNKTDLTQPNEKKDE